MDRITDKTDNGMIYVKSETGEEGVGFLTTQRRLPDIIRKLYEYEELGLTPVQVSEILELFCWSQNFNGDFELFMTALKQIKEMAEKYDDLCD